MENLEKGKQEFKKGFEFINNISVNSSIKNVNAKNTFELVEKGNSNYSLSPNYIRRINIEEKSMKSTFEINLNQRYNLVTSDKFLVENDFSSNIRFM